MKMIKMTKNFVGCPDGIQHELFKEGKVYPVNDDIQKAFVNDLKVAIDHIGEVPE